MPTVEIVVSAKVDGQYVPGFPLTKRIECDEAQTFDYEKATGGGYAALPTGELAEIQVLIVRPMSQQVTLRLDAQSDAGIIVNAGGFAILCDVDIDAGAATNATIDNSSSSTTSVRGVAAGT